MRREELLKPIDFEVEDSDGNKKTFIISKFPALAGREIIAKYISSGMPKVGDYSANEEIMLKMMKYVGVAIGDEGLINVIETKAQYNNFIESWEMSLRIEAAIMEYNCSFFQNGKASQWLSGLSQKAPAWLTKMLMGLSAQLSATEKPLSGSSEKTTI